MAYKNVEDRRAYNRKRYAENPEVRRKMREVNAAWEATLPNGKFYTPEYGRITVLRRYKMTVEEYETLLEKQGGHCALCPTVQGEDKRYMAVDHSHACCDTKAKSCGECNRGLLCVDCNIHLAAVEAVLTMGTIVPKEGTWLSKALAYLDSYKKL
jgi:hypothetical protein